MFECRKETQAWECIVTDVATDSITCEMYDITDPTATVEFAEIGVEELGLVTFLKLKEGSVLYWTVGYEHNEFGTIRRYSTFRVRDVKWTPEDVQRAKERANRIYDALNHPETYRGDEVAESL